MSVQVTAENTGSDSTIAANVAVFVRGLGKFCREVEALRSIDLDIPRRKLTTLLGPSGCGKTTLLKIIGGLIDVSSTGRFLPPPSAATRNISILWKRYGRACENMPNGSAR